MENHFGRIFCSTWLQLEDLPLEAFPRESEKERRGESVGACSQLSGSQVRVRCNYYVRFRLVLHPSLNLISKIVESAADKVLFDFG